MPAPLGPLFPMLLGSATAGAAHNLWRWNRGETRYINPAPPAVATSTSARMAKRGRSYTRTQTRRKRRGRRGLIRRRIPRALVPREKTVRLRAVSVFDSTSTSGVLAMVPVNLFDITDPFAGSAANQPLGYDQLKTLWNKAFVMGVKVSIRAHNESTVGIAFGITPMPESQGSTALTTFPHYAELAATKFRILSPEVDHGILVHTINLGKFVGVKKPRYEDAFHVDLDNETSPTRTAYYHIWTQPIDRLATANVELIITVEYLVRLFDPIVPARSTDS